MCDDLGEPDDWLARVVSQDSVSMLCYGATAPKQNTNLAHGHSTNMKEDFMFAVILSVCSG